MHPRRKSSVRQRDPRERYATYNSWCTHAYITILRLSHRRVFHLLLFFSLCFFFFFCSTRKWILCRGFVEPSVAAAGALYLIVKMGNTRRPCNVMKTAHIHMYCPSLFSSSLLVYYVIPDWMSAIFTCAIRNVEIHVKWIRSKIFLGIAPRNQFVTAVLHPVVPITDSFF